jgi:hypothetical protein
MKRLWTRLRIYLTKRRAERLYWERKMELRESVRKRR